MNTHSVSAALVVTHERRVDTYIENGPTVTKRRAWGQQALPMNVSRVVTTFRRRQVAGEWTGKGWDAEQKVYARSTLKDGSPSSVETSIKREDWTPELEDVLRAIADENDPTA